MAKQHKQKSFIAGFPVYAAIGAYHLAKTIFAPVLKLWNTSSDALYNNISKQNQNIEDVAVTGLSGSENPGVDNAQKAGVKKIETGADAAVGALVGSKKKRTAKVPAYLLKAREELINSINTTNEIRSEKPLTYKYTAMNPEGKIITSTFLSFSRNEVYQFLENEGNVVYKLETSPLIEKLYGTQLGGGKVKNKDLVFWLQQLATYLRSGIPLTDSMRILSKQMGKNANLKRVLDSIIYYLTLGESFSSCLEKQNDAFPSLLVNMVKSAEATGDLEGTLEDMADYYGETEKTKKEMKTALTYPVMVMVFSIAVVVFMLVYLMPQFVGIYSSAGVKLNPITAFLISLSGFLTNNLLNIIIGIFVAIVTFIVCFKKIKAFRYSVQSFAMRFPLFGKIIIYKEIMIFTKTFSSLLKNNVFITESIDILSKVTNNEIYREIMINTVNYISRGEKISSAFKDHWAVPDVAYYMMVTGESTGELAEMMARVADYYSIQHKAIIDSMKSMLEPFLIIFLAITVGGIMVAVIVPMFSLYGEIL